ncbi:MAG: 3-demethylubiquinone-9 3-O-methyltransferase [Bdellovibrionaceae bacterium]|nr:3-demethylubiquinone-9 3-O-methyltransferase [Bdellovibrio sp.]
MEKTTESVKVNNDIYDAYGDRWYTAFDDPVALLRAESKTKTPWILDQIQKNKCTLSVKTHVLDVGCGGGFLSNALAEAGLRVTGVDLSEESLHVAHKHDLTQTVTYQKADAYHLPFPDQTFEVVTAMDFLEHVEDPAEVIKEFSRVLKPGGLFIFHTFNRNPIAHLVVIKLVEWLVKNTPKHMHIIRLFIKPKELQRFCLEARLLVKDMVGIQPVFSSIPLKSIFSGVVPESLRFKLVKSLLLSYMGSAIKESNLH